MKKTLLLFLCLILAISLIGCANNKNDTEKSNPDNNVENNVGDAIESEKIPNMIVTPSTEEGTLSYEQMLSQIQEKADKIENDNIPVMKVGNYTVSLAEYRLYYMSYIAQFLSYFGPDWQNDQELLDMFNTYFSEDVKMCGVVTEIAAANNISLTQEELDDNILNPYDEYVAQYGTNYIEELENQYVTPYFLMLNNLSITLYNKLYIEMFKEGSENERIAKEYADNAILDHIRAKHILLKFPENVTEEQKVQLLEKANQVLEKAKADNDFDSLIKEYNEDPGMTQSTDGYFFTKGEMVEPFEKAAYALKDNEISDIVESQFGYHIIKKLAVDDEFKNTPTYTEVYDMYFYDYAAKMFNNYVTDKRDSYTEVKVDNFDEVVISVYNEANELIEEAKKLSSANTEE